MQINRTHIAVLLVALSLLPQVVSARALLATASYYSQPYYQPTYYSQPAYYSQPYYQPSYNTTVTVPVTVNSSVNVTGAVSKGGGTFVIDHPLDPFNKLLYHSFVESPDVKNLYDGIVTLDQNGEAVVTLPAYFEALNKDFRYQVKPVDRAMPNLFIKKEESGNAFMIGGGVAGGSVSWQITGIRHDPYILAHPIVPEVEKTNATVVKKGEFLYPEGFERQHWGLWALTLVLVLLYARHLGLLRVLTGRRV
jgi:hypothetical protein